MNAVLQAIKSRRSVRAYDTQKQLSDTDVELILEAGRYAPTAHNEQPWYFTVVQDNALLEQINADNSALLANADNEWLRGLAADRGYRYTYSAPTVIFVSAKDGAMSPETDCSAAVQNMMLAAESLGIGSVWVGLLWPYLRSDGAAAALHLPDGYTPRHAVAFGYASGPKLPAPARKTDIVNYIK